MSSFELIAAFLLDLVLGDPPRFPHPVRWIGRLIVLSERWLRPWTTTPQSEKITGVFWVIGVTVAVFSASAALIGLADHVHPILGGIATVYLAYTTLSVRSLRDAAIDVLKPLQANHDSLARERLLNLVGRQTSGLDQEGMIRATVESVAENTSDGIVAPLFFMALGGAPAAMAYKAINTLDSMVGYRTPRYLNLGWASARIDDAANFVPARLTGLLIAMAAGFLRGTGSRSVRMMLRDGRKHESPNSGFPEAAMAGALGIQLGGPMIHPDKPGSRPTIGDALVEAKPEHIEAAVFVMFGVSVLALCLALSVWLWWR